MESGITHINANIMSRPTIDLLILYNVWLSVSVQQLCSLFNNSMICTCTVVYTHLWQTVVFEVTQQVGGLSQHDPHAFVSPPPMSSRHRILEPYGRWCATIYNLFRVFSYSSLLSERSKAAFWLVLHLAKDN